jgi:Tfp pilus assembly protein FimT
MMDGPTVRRSDGQDLEANELRSVRPSDRPTVGITLVELLVVLVLLGLLTTLGAVSVTSLRPPPDAARLDTLRAARAQAIRGGIPVMLTLDSVPIRFLPDGRVLGGPADPLTGEWR